MEWVQITAKTIDEARDRALDTLGVDEQDVEIEVLEEPRTGLFGRQKGQALIRARVRPAPVRPKVERRDRRPKRDKGGGRKGAGSGSGSGSGSGKQRAKADERPDAREPGKARRKDRDDTGSGRGEEGATMPELTIDEQAEVVSEFLLGLAERFGAEGATTATTRVDDDTVEIALDGADLGLLIGPKGQTLQLVQELARTSVQRRGGGVSEGRVRIDIAGYRKKRSEALARFTEQVAADVIASGSPKALEPMNAADRKVVHDTANGIDGIRTTSEGEDPRRRVVLLPDG